MKTTRMESVACSLCGSPTPARPEFVIRDFPVVRCPVCGVRRVSPRLTREALRTYYDANYWKSVDSVARGYDNYAGDEANIRRTFRRRLGLLAQWSVRTSSPRSLLDVGCAYGFLLQEALDAGWDAYGLEWSEFAAGNAAPAVRNRIRMASLMESPWPEASMDAVTFWDYLEHSPDPKADLAAAARMLKPGGLLSIIIPDAGSMLARIMGSKWEEYKKPEEHLYFFTAGQLASQARPLGLDLVHREWAGKYARLDFALARFKPGDGLFYAIFQAGLKAVRRLNWEKKIAYINPRDKRHLIFRKAVAGARPGNEAKDLA